MRLISWNIDSLNAALTSDSARAKLTRGVLNTIKEKLSNQEYEVFSYMLDGLDYLEISKKLNKSPKQVDNTIQRIKTKIKTTFKEGENYE